MEKCDHHSVDGPSLSSAVKKEGVVYTCPMHPEVIKNEPGNCPACGMPLIPKKIDHQKSGDDFKPEGREFRGRQSDDFSHQSHSDHGAAMTNPQIAKKMEADMRRRFWVSFLLSIPIIMYSPLGINYFGLNLPTPIPANWILFILTTPIVFWTGSIFTTGAYVSLKARQLNMAVLIATGVLAAYLFSVLLTLTGEGETSIDESLVTGESLPVTKAVDAKVVGGSVNLTGTVKFKATQVGSETVLAQIIKLVETAQNSKAQIGR